MKIDVRPRAHASRLPWADEHEILRATSRRFFEERCAPFQEAWDEAGVAPYSIWLEAGEMGLLCPRVSERYGGSGADFLYTVALVEEQARAGVVAPLVSLHSDVVAPYVELYGTEAQKRRVLPRLASGEWISAIAMTEPSGGSDLRAMKTHARREAGGWVVDGRKTFISNGYCAHLIVLAARTDKGVSLFLVETDGLEGFSRGQPLDKLGQWSSDTAELFFDGVRLPEDALLGEVEGQGFRQLTERLAEERLLAGVAAVAIMDRAIEHTIAYTRGRKAFGKAVIDFQNSRFVLAECRTQADVARVFLERCVARFMEGRLSVEEAAMLKWWTTDRQCEIADRCLQLHGGYGYMLEYPIARLWLDSRITRIWGGTNEIMKEIIGRAL